MQLTVIIALIAACYAQELIPLDGICTNEPGHCELGLACVGPKYLMKCKPLVLTGGRCDDAYAVCSGGLTCSNRHCRIERYYECTNEPDWCKAGLSCTGTNEYKKCDKPPPLGRWCSDRDPWLCEKGYVCEFNRCFIAEGYECTNPGSYWCGVGLECAGTTSYKSCVKPVDLGDQCLSDPWQVCPYDLVCDNHICRLPRNEICTDTPHMCATGLECVGDERYKHCDNLIPAGKFCSYDGFGECEKGLVCKQYECRIPKGGDCTGKEDYCVRGPLRCVGPEHNKRCKYPLKIGEACTGLYDVCGEGLVCGGLGKARRCINGADEGRACRIGNPKMQCEPGLICIDGFCRHH